jgi:hypothetical protein
MNMQIVKWLVAHRDVLLKVIEAVKPWRKDLPLIEHWNIVDSVARIVIPALSKEDIEALTTYSYAEEEPVEAFALGAEVSALGLDWVTLIQVIIPILQAILRALADE